MAEEQALVQLMDTLDGLELTKSEYEWLEQRFAAMTEKEQLLFRGAMKLEKPETASEAIDIAGQLHCYELFYSAGDEDALGQFVMKHLFRMLPAPISLPPMLGRCSGRKEPPACFAKAIISGAVLPQNINRIKTSQNSPQPAITPSVSSWPAAPIWKVSG